MIRLGKLTPYRNSLLFPFILLCTIKTALSQRYYISESTDLEIVNTSTEQPEEEIQPYVFNFTILNKGKSPIIINRLEIHVIDIPLEVKAHASDFIRRLKPVSYWEVELPRLEGHFFFHVKYPVQIESEKAETIQVRFFRTREMSPEIEEKFKELRPDLVLPKGFKIYPQYYGSTIFTVSFIEHKNTAVKSSELSISLY